MEACSPTEQAIAGLVQPVSRALLRAILVAVAAMQVLIPEAARAQTVAPSAGPARPAQVRTGITDTRPNLATADPLAEVDASVDPQARAEIEGPVGTTVSLDEPGGISAEPAAPDHGRRVLQPTPIAITSWSPQAMSGASSVPTPQPGEAAAPAAPPTSLSPVPDLTSFLAAAPSVERSGLPVRSLPRWRVRQQEKARRVQALQRRQTVVRHCSRLTSGAAECQWKRNDRKPSPMGQPTGQLAKLPSQTGR